MAEPAHPYMNQHRHKHVQTRESLKYKRTRCQTICHAVSPTSIFHPYHRNKDSFIVPSCFNIPQLIL